MSAAVVIGAGLAGLAAADALARAGAELEVLEARERVGGRTWSRALDDGTVVELGAEFILPGNEAVRALASELGLGLWDKGMRYGEREPRGGLGTDPAELRGAVAQVERAVAALSAPETARELLARAPIPAGAREAILARAEISSASDADSIPATDLTGLAHIDSHPSPSVAGGNQRLALGLASRLGDSVRLGDAATAVEWDRGGVRVRTAAGRTVDAEACVIAVPATVLDRIGFEPRLPRPHREALARLRYGHAAKLFVPLAEPAPPSAVMSVPERYWCWTATGPGPEPMPVVSCFAGSAAALERLEVAAGPGAWLASLASLRPDLALVGERALLASWDDDPWTRAAYSLFPPPAVAAALAEPAGPLAFAGEHVGGRFNGLMEGAIRSGRAAAERLLAARGGR